MVAAINRISNRTDAPSQPDGEESDISVLIARLTAEVDQIACEKTRSIQQITNQMKMLALNALIESSRAGALGAALPWWRQEVRSVGQKVETIARELETQLTGRTANLVHSIQEMTERSRGERMVDLALNAVELIDRNLYERTCDVRWWATDFRRGGLRPRTRTPQMFLRRERLSVILRRYTCISICGCVTSTAMCWQRPVDRYGVKGANVAAMPWFFDALKLKSGDDYVAATSSASRCRNARSRPIAPACAKAATPMASRSACCDPISNWRPGPRHRRRHPGGRQEDRVLLVDFQIPRYRVIRRPGPAHRARSAKRRPQRFLQGRSGLQVAFHLTPTMDLQGSRLVRGDPAFRGGERSIASAQSDLLERDDFSSNRHPALSFRLSMISAQTLRVCREGKTGAHFSGSCLKLSVTCGSTSRLIRCAAAMAKATVISLRSGAGSDAPAPRMQMGAIASATIRPVCRENLARQVLGEGKKQPSQLHPVILHFCRAQILDHDLISMIQISPLVQRHQIGAPARGQRQFPTQEKFPTTVIAARCHARSRSQYSDCAARDRAREYLARRSRVAPRGYYGRWDFPASANCRCPRAGRADLVALTSAARSDH